MINADRVLKTFLDYVSIDSETRSEGKMCERLVHDLKALGLTVKTDDAGSRIGSDGNNIFAYHKGTVPGDPLIFSCHMDTVRPGKGIKPLIDNGIIHTDGSTILAADDKSGIAGVVEALTVIKEKGLASRNVEVVITIAEEGGLNGAKNADFTQLKGKRAVIFDGAGDVGTLVTSAPGQIKMTATVIGRSAHAGLAPETGISSIQVAARGVAEMNLLRIDEETTCNIGTFKSEGATNIVPERTEIIAEIRSRNVDKLKAQAEHLKNCLQKACDEAGARLECDMETKYISFDCADDTEFIEMVSDACRRISCPVTLLPGGGGSDANIMALDGITPLVIGTGMSAVHTTNESISVKNLENTARLALELMKA